jgi:hypothetical protein
MRQKVDAFTFQKITWTNISLGNAIHTLQKDMLASTNGGVNIYFPVSDQLPTISINATNVSCRQLLDQLCRQSDMYWTVVDGFVAISALPSGIIPAGIKIGKKEEFR